MNRSAFHRCLILTLAGVTALSAFACAHDAKLVLRTTARSMQGENVYRFTLTAPSDRPVYYIADKDTGIVLHAAEEKKGAHWVPVGNPWCAHPTYPKLEPGKSAEITVTAPETKRPWRIGIKLYEKKPAQGVRFTEVWSTAVK